MAAVPEPGTWLFAALGSLAALFTCLHEKSNPALAAANRIDKHVSEPTAN